MSGTAASQYASARALRIVEFNLHIARLTHRGWFEQLLQRKGLEDALMDQEGRISARAEPKVSQWLLRQFGLQETFDWDMSEPLKRLWLLDTAALERLCQLLSLAMHRQWLLQIIDGSRLRVLRDVAGPESFRYISDELPSQSFHHEAPTVALDLEPNALSNCLLNDGARTLLHLLDTSWHAVRERAALRFKPGTMHGEVPPLAAGRRDAALELLCGCLIPRRFREWAWLF